MTCGEHGQDLEKGLRENKKYLMENQRFEHNLDHAFISARAFTLIELLVVVSIIALLVAILIPALEDARESASVTVCATRQHQLGIGLIMYAGDNNDCSPPSYGYPDEGGDVVSTYVHYPQVTVPSWPSWRGLGLLYGPTGTLGAYRLTGSYVGNVRELVYCPAAGRLRSKIDDPQYGWPGNPAQIGISPHGAILANHELRQINDTSYGPTKVAELSEKKMAWVFDELVYLTYPEEVSFDGKGFNAMFPDAHVDWMDIPPPWGLERRQVSLWLAANVDGRY